MNDGLGVLLQLLALFLGPALGGVIGYFIAKKRGASVPLSVTVGVLAGPCLGTIIVCVLPASGSSPSGWNGAGRSYGVDENPRLGGKK